MNIRNNIILPAFMIVLLAGMACNKNEVDIIGAPAAVYLVNAIAAEDSTDLQMQFSPNTLDYATARRLTLLGMGWDFVKRLTDVWRSG